MKKFLLLLALFFTPLLALLIQGFSEGESEGSGGGAFAQNKIIDSLITVLKKDKPDTSKVKHLYTLSWQHIRAGLYDTALFYGEQAIQLGEKLNFKKGISASFGNIGIAYSRLGKYSEALDNFFKALKIDEGLGNKIGVTRHLGNMGIVYNAQGDYPKAMDCYLKALKIDEELKDKKGMSIRLGNIGNVYLGQNDYPKAIDYYLKALKIANDLGDKHGASIHLGNIGIIYHKQHDYPKALEHLIRALRLNEELKDKDGTARLLGNIGNVYFEQDRFAKALDYFLKALKMDQALGRKSDIASNLNNIGSLFIKQKKYKAAYDYLYHALTLDDSIGAKDAFKDDYNTLTELYEQADIPLPDSTGGKLLTMEQMRLRSLYYFRRSIALKDTLFSEENKKQLVRKEMNYEFDKKELLAKAEQQAKDQKAKNEKEIVYGVLVLLIVCVAGIAWFFIQRRKLDKIKAVQEKEALEKNKLELELKWFNSELKALRSQMNPHFIFNCMASIQRFMIQNDAVSAARFLSKFARLMRSILENSEQSFISLESELKMLEDYLDLEKLRFGKKFNYFISVENTINSELIEIPSMLIQPYIENSIIHGIGPRKDENGRIDLTFKITGTVLHCEIIDNGVGIKKSSEIKSQMEFTHKSLGMSILKERLELINAKENIDVYSRMTDMEDDDHNPLGTKVELNIPLRNRKLT